MDAVVHNSFAILQEQQILNKHHNLPWNPESPKSPTLDILTKERSTKPLQTKTKKFFEDNIC